MPVTSIRKSLWLSGNGLENIQESHWTQTQACFPGHQIVLCAYLGHLLVIKETDFEPFSLASDINTLLPHHFDGLHIEGGLVSVCL